ncbi:MAG: hypothetical protein HY420_02030 [Candidatus Kerfeldbacteria bacterium]|nr:hypothetical protein [Candidatus Kerfeldbacteria bacterium]
MIRAYFYGPPTTKRDLNDVYEVIKDVCQRADVALSTNTEKEEINLPSETIAEHRATGVPLLDAMQAILVEGTTPDPQAGYLLAYALAEKRPLLYLYSRGEVAPDVLRYLNLKDIPKHIVIATYSKDRVEKLVEDFLRQLGDIKIREVARIKFTLRLTRTIDDYLDFKTRNTKLSKADFLREDMDKRMKADEEFQQHLRKRRG